MTARVELKNTRDDMVLGRIPAWSSGRTGRDGQPERCRRDRPNLTALGQDSTNVSATDGKTEFQATSSRRRPMPTRTPADVRSKSPAAIRIPFICSRARTTSRSRRLRRSLPNWSTRPGGVQRRPHAGGWTSATRRSMASSLVAAVRTLPMMSPRRSSSCRRPKPCSSQRRARAERR